MTTPLVKSTTDELIEELEAAAKGMQGWPNDASFKSDDAWCVGTVDEDGNLYPVIEVQVEQYDAEHFAEPMADYYAAANPANVLALIARIRELEDVLRMYSLPIGGDLNRDCAEFGGEAVHREMMRRAVIKDAPEPPQCPAT